MLDRSECLANLRELEEALRQALAEPTEPAARNRLESILKDVQERIRELDQ